MYTGQGRRVVYRQGRIVQGTQGRVVQDPRKDQELRVSRTRGKTRN